MVERFIRKQKQAFKVPIVTSVEVPWIRCFVSVNTLYKPSLGFVPCFEQLRPLVITKTRMSVSNNSNQ